MRTVPGEVKSFWKIILAGILGIIAIGVFFWGNHVIDVFKARSIASREWPTVQGRVLNSRAEEEVDVDENGSDRHYHYTATITYEYVVNAVRYTNDRLGWEDHGQRGSMAQAQELADSYPNGKVIVVYYDPEKPDFSLLEISLPKNPDEIGLKSFILSGAILALAAAFLCAHFGLFLRIHAAIILIVSLVILTIAGLWTAFSYNHLTALIFGFGLASFATGFFAMSLDH